MGRSAISSRSCARCRAGTGWWSSRHFPADRSRLPKKRERAHSMRRLILATMTAAATLATIAVVHAHQHVVTQKDRAFSTETITIKPGDEVTFKNADDVTHNVFSNTS